jgi:hypothetical protein
MWVAHPQPGGHGYVAMVVCWGYVCSDDRQRPSRSSCEGWSVDIWSLGMHKKIFRSPPGAYKSQPLWHLNAKLSREEIIRPLRVAKDKSGFGGIAPLPVTETQPAFLSDDYFLHPDVLDACCHVKGAELHFQTANNHQVYHVLLLRVAA